MASVATDRQRVKVSVIVAVKNGALTLSECLRSILVQRRCELELILVDGMSTDGTADVVASFSDDRLIVIREPDDGIYDAWNKALRIARGTWCAFLGSDDAYVDDFALDSLLEEARRSHVTPAYVFGGVRMVGSLEPVVHHSRVENPVRYLRRGAMLPHQGSLHRTELLNAIGGFDASYRVCGDRPAVLALARMGAVARCDRVVTNARVGGISNAKEGRRLTEKEWHRFLRHERGELVAGVLLARQVALRLIGRTLERILRILGERRGASAFLALRRILGRPPRSSPLGS